MPRSKMRVRIELVKRDSNIRALNQSRRVDVIQVWRGQENESVRRCG